jgi:hypothetical protein
VAFLPSPIKTATAKPIKSFLGLPSHDFQSNLIRAIATVLTSPP